jgi:hypothetical protein
MDPRIANEFLDACNRAFGFLVTEHDFQSAALEIRQEIHFAVVRFVAANVAVECVFDQRESWVEVKIVRLVNGAVPIDYSTDSAGRRVREGLYLVRKHGDDILRDSPSVLDA